MLLPLGQNTSVRYIFIYSNKLREKDNDVNFEMIFDI